METTLLPTINKQLLHLDQSYGSDTVAADFVLSLISTLDDYKGDNSPDALQIGILEIYNLLLACRPRMANLVFDLQETLLHTIDTPDFNKETIRNRLLELLGLKRSRRHDSVKHAQSLVEGIRSILLHSYSSTLNMLLREVSKGADKPDIILAAQEPQKTERMIRLLQKHGFVYRVVSEFAVAHVIEEVNLALFGGLTLTSDMQILMGPGSASLISQLNSRGIASYVMLTTNKFSFWEEPTAKAFKESRAKKLDTFSYTKEVYSHDVLPISLLAGIITENGVLTPHQAQSVFRKMQEQFFGRERRIRELG
ncbi:MAG: hypothetical protein KDD70_00755 [Bdellovibrionales bacterium]|nr:hypothetical protein [Bdellovibrionales bacterium]